MDDIEAIRQLTARYGRASDGNAIDDWLECFTDDGIFRRGDNGRSWKGETELRDMFISYPITGRHVTTDFIIAVDGDTAHQSCYLLFFDGARQYQLHMFGVYEDELTKRNGSWRFRERVLTATEVRPPEPS